MKKKKKTNTISLKKKIAYFIAYLCLFLAIFGMIDYYAYDILNPWFFISVSFISAFFATVLHLKSHSKSQIDVFEKEIEEII